MPREMRMVVFAAGLSSVAAPLRPYMATVLLLMNAVPVLTRTLMLLGTEIVKC